MEYWLWRFWLNHDRLKDKTQWLDLNFSIDISSLKELARSHWKHLDPEEIDFWMFPATNNQ